jgi:foldase protein PrsA
MLLQQLYEGTDFDVLMEQYNEAEEGTVSFGKGEVNQILEDAAFNLDNGEISGIVETEDAYIILKCVSTFNREETEANKVRIVEERKREVFGKQYNDYASKLSRIFNNELWKKIKINYSETVTTTSFFDVYQKHFNL